MIAILKIDENKNITGWIIAVDLAEARTQAGAAFQEDLLDELYRIESHPMPGRHELKSGYTLLSC